MTDLIKVMQQRQSCRSFADKPVEAEKLVSCINAACLAPSACNTQPYHFYVAHAPEAVAVAAEYCKGEKYNKWVGEAKAFVIITQEHAEIPAANSEARKRDFRQYDIGLMIENFCLEATELGLGTCILGLFNEHLAGSQHHILINIEDAFALRLSADAKVHTSYQKSGNDSGNKGDYYFKSGFHMIHPP